MARSKRMDTWAVLAAKPAAIATGSGVSLVPAIGTAAEQFEPNGDQQAPAAEQAPGQDDSDSRRDGFAGDRAEDGAGEGGYQSRHRLGEGSPIRRPRRETRRTAPKHAAPPSSFASQLADMFAGPHGTQHRPALTGRPPVRHRPAARHRVAARPSGPGNSHRVDSGFGQVIQYRIPNPLACGRADIIGRGHRVRRWRRAGAAGSRLRPAGGAGGAGAMRTVGGGR